MMIKYHYWKKSMDPLSFEVNLPTWNGVLGPVELSLLAAWALAEKPPEAWDFREPKLSWFSFPETLPCILTVVLFLLRVIHTLQATHISPWQGMFEDDFSFPNANYVSFLEGTSLSKDIRSTNSSSSKIPKNPLFPGPNILRVGENSEGKVVETKKVMIHWVIRRHVFFSYGCFQK